MGTTLSAFLYNPVVTLCFGVALMQIQGDLDRNEQGLNEIIQQLADYPPIYIGRDAPSDAKDGDFWLKTP